MTAIVASCATRERDESAEDDAVADLVLRAADDDDGSIGHRLSLAPSGAPREDSRVATDRAVRRRLGHPESPCENAAAMSEAAPPPGLRPVPGSAKGRGRVTVDLSDVIDRGTRRRAGVFRRALRREASRLRDPRRIAAILLLSLTFAVVLSGLIARGEAGGADARAYWAGVRIWLNGGDPYHPTGPFLPYVYAPWMLPLFAPWALLPWDVAWFVWRVGTIVLLLWTIHWAYRRRPLTTAVIVAILGVPVRGEPRHRQHQPPADVDAVGRAVHRSAARWPPVGPGDLDEMGPGRLLADPPRPGETVGPRCGWPSPSG